MSDAAEGISVDEIQRIYENGYGVRASEQLRAENAAATKRFHDSEAGGSKPAQSPTLIGSAHEETAQIESAAEEDMWVKLGALANVAHASMSAPRV